MLSGDFPLKDFCLHLYNGGEWTFVCGANSAAEFHYTTFQGCSSVANPQSMMESVTVGENHLSLSLFVTYHTHHVFQSLKEEAPNHFLYWMMSAVMSWGQTKYGGGVDYV